ncbi:MAG: hypothetical protein Q4F95_00945 [Oscillospiraceae bacterium]|nr:hypothetical protein [Oscillospiraceae bacterium]
MKARIPSDKSSKKDKESKSILTKEIYEKELLPIYKEEKYNPKTIVVFEIVLPYHIPIEKNSIINVNTNDVLLSYKFDTVTVDESYKNPLEVDKKLYELKKSKIQIIVATQLDYLDYQKKIETYNNEYFDLFLVKLNKVILGYSIKKKDCDCHYLTKEMFASFLIVESINLKPWNTNKVIFLLNLNVPLEKDLIKVEEIQELGRVQSVVINNLNPFVKAEQYVFMAKRYWTQGFYLETVIFIQISIDVIIRILLQELLKIKNVTPNKIEERLNEIIFIKVVRTGMPSYLGGDWDTESESNAAGRWYHNTYKLRNKAVHMGYIPSYTEAEDAIKCAMEFRDFIMERIIANKNEYPYLYNYFFNI